VSGHERDFRGEIEGTRRKLGSMSAEVERTRENPAEQAVTAKAKNSYFVKTITMQRQHPVAFTNLHFSTRQGASQHRPRPKRSRPPGG